MALPIPAVHAASHQCHNIHLYRLAKKRVPSFCYSTGKQRARAHTYVTRTHFRCNFATCLKRTPQESRRNVRNASILIPAAQVKACRREAAFCELCLGAAAASNPNGRPTTATTTARETGSRWHVCTTCKSQRVSLSNRIRSLLCRNRSVDCSPRCKSPVPIWQTAYTTRQTARKQAA